MSQKLLTTSDLIKWCDEQVAQGKELGMSWEGGGDSGWVYFTIDGDQVSDSAENDQIRQLVDRMYDELDYGSWAGEFSAQGEAIYSPEQKAFVGTDYYGEDSTVHQECSINIVVPKSLWFDAVEYNMENEDPNIDFAFIVRNGFLTEAHEKVRQQIIEDLDDAVEQEIKKYTSQEYHEDYRSIWQSDRIQRSDFREVGDNLVYTIEEIGIGVIETQDKDIYLELITDEDDY
jgi:hypothetical protein